MLLVLSLTVLPESVQHSVLSRQLDFLNKQPDAVVLSARLTKDFSLVDHLFDTNSPTQNTLFFDRNNRLKFDPSRAALANFSESSKHFLFQSLANNTWKVRKLNLRRIAVLLDEDKKLIEKSFNLHIKQLYIGNEGRLSIRRIFLELWKQHLQSGRSSVSEVEGSLSAAFEKVQHDEIYQCAFISAIGEIIYEAGDSGAMSTERRRQILTWFKLRNLPHPVIASDFGLEDQLKWLRGELEVAEELEKISESQESQLGEE